jgi:hypothetical protein
MHFLLFFLVLQIHAPSAFLCNESAHPIHVSMCELNYNETSSSFQVSLKIFIDDLELSMKQEGYPPLNLGSVKEDTLAQEHLLSYLNKYFFIEIDGQKLVPKFVGKEISEDFLAVWCYIEYPAVIARGQKCTLTNSVLLDMYNDQKNIMNISMGKTQKDYAILDSGHPSWSYTF